MSVVFKILRYWFSFHHIERHFLPHSHGKVMTLKWLLQCFVCFRYTFWTEGYDIKFCIFYKEDARQSDKVAIELQRNTKVNCHHVPEDGTIECQKPGICEYTGTCIRVCINAKYITKIF